MEVVKVPLGLLFIIKLASTFAPFKSNTQIPTTYCNETVKPLFTLIAKEFVNRLPTCICVQVCPDTTAVCSPENCSLKQSSMIYSYNFQKMLKSPHAKTLPVFKNGEASKSKYVVKDVGKRRFLEYRSYRRQQFKTKEVYRSRKQQPVPETYMETIVRPLQEWTEEHRECKNVPKDVFHHAHIDIKVPTANRVRK